jgi:hypothetical protein
VPTAHEAAVPGRPAVPARGSTQARGLGPDNTRQAPAAVRGSGCRLSHRGDECYRRGQSLRLRPPPDWSSRHRMAACHKGLLLKSRDFAKQTPFDHFFNSAHWQSTCLIGPPQFSSSRQSSKTKAMKALICFADSRRLFRHESQHGSFPPSCITTLNSGRRLARATGCPQSSAIPRATHPSRHPRHAHGLSARASRRALAVPSAVV